MKKKKGSKLPPQTETDYYLNDEGDELVMSIRTNDGMPLTAQDVLDACMAAIEECYGPEGTPIIRTKEEIESDEGYQ